MHSILICACRSELAQTIPGYRAAADDLLLSGIAQTNTLFTVR